MNKNKFLSLTPEVLDENKKVYDDALSEAFSNKNVKNIAITGIYGSGKSTVWETYKYKNNLENVISVSLGQYEDVVPKNIVKTQTNNDTSENERPTIPKIDNFVDGFSETADLENNIERQLINQIVAQVDNKTIPLSKYRYLENKSTIESLFDIVLVFIFILGLWLTVFLGNYKTQITPYFRISIPQFIIIIILMLLIPSAYFLYGISKNRKISFSKIKFGSAEANLKEQSNKDETVLDRDIRELVYILYNSDSNVVVFEDLDRYNHLDIYKKLRELNFLLNSFISANYKKNRFKQCKEERIVRFVYLLKDGLFYSKNRTKFFDFIVPVIPVVNSKNSEDKLLEFFDKNENSPSKTAIFNISLYIDDMRLIKNIYNEYNVYYEIIPIEKLKLSKDKLFSLIVLKNIFPKEFDELQQDRGYIYNFIKDKDRIKTTVTSHLDLELEHAEEMNLEEFLEKYIYLNDDIRKKVEEYPENQIKKLELLKERKESILMEIKDINLLSISNLLKRLDVDQRERLYLDIDNPIIKSHYFPLIKYLLNEGLIDETYWHYKGYFYENSLGKNDTLFLKNMLEGSKQDLFMKLENSELVFERMAGEDFLRNNIFNSDIIERTIFKGATDRINNILLSAVRSNQMEDLLNIFLSFKESNKTELIKDFVISIFGKNYKTLYSFMTFVENNNDKLFNRLLLFLFSQDVLPTEIVLFKEMIEKHSQVLMLLQNNSDSLFLKNLINNDIKFSNFENVEIDLDIISEIARNNLYTLSVQNVHYMVNELRQKEVEGSCLLQKILEEQKLDSIKDRIESDFITFMTEYIDFFNDIHFDNNEKTVFKILNSSLDSSHKAAYLERNNTTISTLSDFKNINEQIQPGIVYKLFETNKLVYSYNNIESYLENEGKISDRFLEYLELHTRNESIPIKKEDSVICQSKQLCNMILGVGNLSDALFSRVVIGADEALLEIEDNYPENRLIELFDKKLLDINDTVLRYILDHKYISALVLICNKEDFNVSEVLSSNSEYYNRLDSTDIYTLINKVNSQEDILKLIRTVGVELDLSKVDLKKDEIIKYALQNNLLGNLNFILSNFKDFDYKDEFIDRLQEEMNFEDIDFNLLSDSFITYVINSPTVNEQNKAGLINTVIRNSNHPDDFIKYLESFEDIADLARVFLRGHPKVDTHVKEMIVSELKEKGYVKAHGPERIRKGAFFNEAEPLN
ncbi:hypothetical protein PT072_08880 [Erysipelothrix rhusiopathiae]|nr:hypothetical protein [Erysipelothrix rhusiopathiae]